jgi:hypothetical protein
MYLSFVSKPPVALMQGVEHGVNFDCMNLSFWTSLASQMSEEFAFVMHQCIWGPFKIYKNVLFQN